MAKSGFFGGFLGPALTTSVSLALSVTAVGCGGPAKQSASPSEVSSQPSTANEPDLIATVVGTVGRDHLLKDGYPLSKIADIIDTFKPDMILIPMRTDDYKQQHYEDASFEMTYVNAVAGTAGVDVEPIGWFKDEDTFPPGVMDDATPAPSSKKPKKGAKPAPLSASVDASAAKAPPGDPYNFLPPVPVDPDFADAFKSESAYASTLGPLSFADANSDDITGKIWDSMSTQIRYAKGYSAYGRRVAWLGYNATQAFNKQKGQTHRLMIVVNVRYRAPMEQLVMGLGAVLRDPVAIVKSMDQAPDDAIPDDVITQWRRSIDNLRERIPKHGPDTLRTNLLQKIAILEAAVSKKGACCVDASAMAPKASDAN